MREAVRYVFNPYKDCLEYRVGPYSFNMSMGYKCWLDEYNFLTKWVQGEQASKSI